MQDYLKSQKYYLPKIWFDHRGARYSGRGILRWTPADGFFLDAFVNREASKEPRGSFTIDLKVPRLIEPSDIVNIRALDSLSRWLVMPHANLSVRLDLLWDNRLSVPLDYAVFGGRLPVAVDDIHGSALFEVGKTLHLPGFAEETISIQGQDLHKTRKHGFIHEQEGLWLSCRMLDDSFATLDFVDSGNLNRKHQWWDWLEGLGYALSLLCGRSVSLCRRRIVSQDREYTSLLKRYEIANLDKCLLLFDDQAIIRPKQLIQLTNFLVKDKVLADAAKKAFRQLLDASRQVSFQGRELLCATILEALLRTVNNEPFVPGKVGRGWDAEGSMRRFRDRFLSLKWRAICKRVLTAHKRLRNRNAHPDWLVEPGGDLSGESIMQSLYDTTLLSRFYGQAILALAGDSDLQPDFPEWLLQDRKAEG
jgi:hypothetical protein